MIKFMKKHNIYLGLFFSLVCSVLFFPNHVFAVSLQLPDEGDCYTPHVFMSSLNRTIFYFIVSENVSEDINFLDSTGGLLLSEITRNPIIKCMQLGDLTDDRIPISYFKEVVIPTLPFVGSVEPLFVRMWRPTQRILSEGDFFHYNFKYVSVLPDQRASAATIESFFEQKNTEMCDFQYAVRKKGNQNPIKENYRGECSVYYQNNQGNRFSVYYLGSSANPNFGPIGGLTWPSNEIVIGRGEKATYNVSVVTDPTDLDLTISCANCGSDAGLTLGSSSGNTSKTFTITVDASKIKDLKVELRARTAGTPYFESTHIIPIQVTSVDCTKYNQNQCATNAECWWYPGYSGENKCIAEKDIVECAKVPKELCGTKNGSSYCTYLETTNTCTDYLSASYQGSYDVPGADDYFGPLPPCAFDGSCRNVNDLIQLFINFGKMTLGIVGSAALVFFVYGGVMMILSMGNSERVKKGKDILVASIIGIVIAFSAYALINFVLDVLNVSTDFRVIEETK